MPSTQAIPTLIATFNDYRTAEQAASELTEIGISRDSIEIQSNSRTAGAGSGGSEPQYDNHEGGIAGWWHRLIGDDDSSSVGNDASEYEEAVNSGGTVLSVSVPEQDVD